MYQYTQKDEPLAVDISLHDCRATQMEIDGEDIIFRFEDGFCITPENEANSTGEVLYTGRAQLRIIRPDSFEAHLLHEDTRFGYPPLSVKERITPEQLAEMLNSGDYELEFISEFIGYKSYYYQCWLWFDRKPYHVECQLEARCCELEYSWDMKSEADK